MSPKEPEGKKQISAMLPEDLVERAKNIVYWSPGLTFNGMVEAGLRHLVERMEKVNGGPYSTRSASQLPVGRPLAPAPTPKRKRR